MIEVRRATPADAAVWARMRHALWPDEDAGSLAAETREYFAARLPMLLEVLLAEDESRRIVGFAELSIRNYAEHCETNRVAYLEAWYVEPDARRRGVGRALVVAAEAWGRTQGCVEFGSDAVIDNDVSAMAHRALGFAETEQIRCFRKVLVPGEADGRSAPAAVQYMVIETFRNGDPAPVYRRFRERGRMMPEGLEYVRSWVTDDLTRCFQVMQCADRALLDDWMREWSDLIDFEVLPVLSSAEVQARIATRW